MIDYPHIPLTVGSRITVNLSGGLGADGTVEALDYDDDGGLRVLTIRDQPDREECLKVRGDLIIAWREGAPIPQPPLPAPPGIVVPVPPGMLGPNRRGQG
jgi:hypothetical protein